MLGGFKPSSFILSKIDSLKYFHNNNVINLIVLTMVDG
jgi:hypothetical protein